MVAAGLTVAGVNLARTAQPRTGAAGSLVLAGATVYVSPSETPIADGIIVVRDAVIAAVGTRGSVRVPPDATTLDCSGLTVTAGFWNSHVHFGERKWADASNIPAAELVEQLQTMLTRYGFTSVFDLSSPWENTRRIRDRIESGEVAGPRIRSTGQGMLGKGSAPPDIMIRVLGQMVTPQFEVETAADTLAAAKQLLNAGTDGLKVFAASWQPPYRALPTDAIRAAVDEAHRRKKPVFAHPQTLEGLIAAVRAGVDVIAHTTHQSGPWDEATVRTMRDANVALIPTLKVWKYLPRHERASVGEKWIRTTRAQLEAWLTAQGVVLFGTDAGGIDDYDPSDEYVLMAAAGMTDRQILAALTTAPANRFGESAKLGRIASGLAADLVALNGDPSRDVRAFAAVRYAIRDGRVIYQAPLNRAIGR